MFNLRFGRHGLGSGLAVALLAGCGGESGTSLNPSTAGLAAERSHSGPAYSVLYSFGGSGDGSDPDSVLNKINGTLYGTTQQGGANGYGTVYTITTSGTETVLYSFKGGPSDGSYPGGLIIINGTHYGTTSGGGANGYGTVFTITTSGTEKVLYSFKGGPSDGSDPSGLLNVNGTLYGTTGAGGANGDGTVFTMTQTGQEKVLHSFGGSGDGSGPYAGLTNVNGTLYGTTFYGGTIGSARRDGTVFSITKTGKEKVLHSFKGRPSDGKFPSSTLINVNGTLYGTTVAGGANGQGTVFTITTSGTETVLYSFKGGLAADGGSPSGRFLNVNGTLYGTTSQGGAYGSGYGHNYGTVYTITTSGTETVLHSFEGAPTDGRGPIGRLLNVNGTLYGVTVYGSANGYGDAGTVFSLTP